MEDQFISGQPTFTVHYVKKLLKNLASTIATLPKKNMSLTTMGNNVSNFKGGISHGKKAVHRKRKIKRLLRRELKRFQPEGIQKPPVA
ncbi:hypothetical protein MKZ02_12480 [Pseudobacillus sp. FSL P4-0506]|uniref:hypothetical protein n=1 Tax=Pseudobacillus sp. FSL P4-0506 TaxID=2921576 RepID=UPI0030F9BB7E